MNNKMIGCVSAMTMADQYTFEGKDSLVHLEFFFESCNLTKMKDYSKEIETLRQKICQLNNATIMKLTYDFVMYRIIP